MSKCQSEFAAYCINEGIISQQYSDEILPIWQAAWNARGKVDAEVCRHPGYIEDQEQYYGNLMAEAIEQENEK